MLHTSELDMDKTITPDDVDVFLDNAAWAIHSTYHTVLKASPGAAIFGLDMLFDILFISNWNKIGDYRQHQTDLNTELKNSKQVDYDLKLVIWFCWHRKVSSAKQKAHTAKSHGLSQQFIKMELSGFNAEHKRLNFRRVTHFVEE
jgi:hypothetical protein